MAFEEFDDLEPESSTGTTTQDAATTPEGGTAPADSSTATDGTVPDASALSIVRDVVGTRTDGAAASSADGSEGGTPADGAATPTPADPDDFSDVPFHKHPRFQEVVRERKAFKQDAERYQNVQTFLDNHGLSADEAADGLVIMALMKTEPVAAWQKLRPLVQKLLVAAGEVLPDDLQARVDSKELTLEAATEVSRSRATVQSVTTKTTFEQQRRERQEQQTVATTLHTTAQDWVTDRQTKDPNFEAKSPLLQREIAFLQSQEGKPDTPEGVRAQLLKAYEAVNKTFKPPAPAAKPVTQTRPAVRPVVGGTVSGTAPTEPKNTLDIVRANRRRSA